MNSRQAPKLAPWGSAQDNQWRLRGVTDALISWGAKNISGPKAACAELQRPRVGRKARITGTVEEMLPPDVIE